MVLATEGGEPVDRSTLENDVRSAVADVVRKQVDTGVDVINDGEMSKPSYATYVKDRLSGFGGKGSARHVLSERRDVSEFPDLTEESSYSIERVKFVSCDGPIGYEDLQAVEKDLENLIGAVNDAPSAPSGGTFMSAASPGAIAMFFANHYYPDEESYLDAIATAMREEYEAIHRAGVVLQLDCPDLALPVIGTAPEEYRANLAIRIAALNHAVANIPAEAMRVHVCWGNGRLPRKNDVPLKDIVDLLFTLKPDGLMLMASNGRHAHEWKVFADTTLPEGKYLIPGVLDPTTVTIEHPEVVADRIVRYASVVGKENVMAGTDCGFATMAGGLVPPSIVWAKFDAMAEGAALASAELW
jgi:5-methyltetrahydropteroyltriglutamate--homocysteine methyltransferase